MRVYGVGKFVQVPSSASYLGKFKVYQGFFFLKLSIHSFFTRKTSLKFSERLMSIRKEHFHEKIIFQKLRQLNRGRSV